MQRLDFGWSSAFHLVRENSDSLISDSLIVVKPHQRNICPGGILVPEEYSPRRNICPGGAIANSPALSAPGKWEKPSSPGGTTEMRNRCDLLASRASGTALARPCLPGAESAGLLAAAPPGAEWATALTEPSSALSSRPEREAKPSAQWRDPLLGATNFDLGPQPCPKTKFA